MKRVIKADDAGEFLSESPEPVKLADVGVEARLIISQARRQRDQIIEHAREQASKIEQEAQEKAKSQAREQGLREGYDLGVKQARDEIQKTLNAEAGELSRLAGRILQELTAAKEELMREASGELLDLAIEIARKVVGSVAVHDISAARANLAKVIELVDPAPELLVKVNPEQLDQLQSQMGELTESLCVRGLIRLVADNRVSHGGVRLVTRQGEVDATIETQIRNVVEALVGPGWGPLPQEAS